MDNQINDIGHCLYCGEILVGRSDKKFCSTRHKNAYHNKRFREKNEVYKMIDNQLHLNHKVLEEYYGSSNGKIFLNEKPLILAGFNSRYFIGILDIGATGERLYVVYNYGFVTNNLHQIKIYFKNGGF